MSEETITIDCMCLASGSFQCNHYRCHVEGFLLQLASVPEDHCEMREKISFLAQELSRKPLLNAHHVQARLLWAQDHLEWENQWDNVLFTDEKKFNLDGPDGDLFYWHDIRKEERHAISRQHGGASVMVANQIFNTADS